jgi:Peptidase family S41
MTTFARMFSAVLLVGAASMPGSVVAEDVSNTTERFVGQAQIASQPPLPIHLDLRRAGDAVEGTISIPMGEFALVATQGDGQITGRFTGAGGEGEVTLVIAEDALTGTFTLGEASGTIAVQATTLDARTFFLPPQENLALTADQWLEDLDRLTEILTQEHGSPYHRITGEAFEREVARVRAAIPDLDGIAVALEFRKLGALIGDGHTEVALPGDRPRLPIELFWFEDGLRVVGMSAQHRGLLGSRLIAVGAMPVEEAVERMRPFIPAGETEGFFRAAAADLFGDPDVFRAAGIAEGPSFALAFEAEYGEHVEVDVTASKDGEWATLGDGAPLWRRNEAQGFWSEVLGDGSVYVNWRSYNGLAEQADALLQQLDAENPRRLIIDLRDNTGGDFNLGRALVEEIRNRPWLNEDGVLYVLIGRKTFSAAMTNAVDFRTTTSAILVGEPVGAAPNNWQEVRRFNLPNSGLSVSVSTLYYEFLPGEAEVRPDLQVLPEPADWGAAEDASLRLILSQP